MDNEPKSVNCTHFSLIRMNSLFFEPDVHPDLSSAFNDLRQKDVEISGNVNGFLCTNEKVAIAGRLTVAEIAT